MSVLTNHIVLIGFKHVGKSVIGQMLARKLNRPFIDLDQQIELLYEKQFGMKSHCRQIMKLHGESFFRRLEIDALRQTVNFKSSVISLGGGTPLDRENQQLIKSSIRIHITAPRGIVYERIMISGRPAFFIPGEDLLESFTRLWDERNKIYEKINDFSIENKSSVADAVNQIINKINFLECAI